MPHRDRRQCRERWTNYLSPAVANGPWTHEEEDLLKAKVAALGHSWRAIQPFFPGRTDINIKNHWKQMEKAPTLTQKSEPAMDIFEQLRRSWITEASAPMMDHNDVSGLGALF
jgi:hypothetical protein